MKNSYRNYMKGLRNLWNDAYVQRGVRVEVSESIDKDGRTVYAVTSDGEWGEEAPHGTAAPIPGYIAKRWIFNDILGISDYQEYQERCAPTPTWDTVIRIVRSKGCEVTRNNGKLVFVG